MLETDRPDAVASEEQPCLIIISNSGQTVSHNYSEWGSHETQLLHVEELKAHTKCPTVRRRGQICTHLYTRDLGSYRRAIVPAGGSYQMQMQMQSIKLKLTGRYHADAINLLMGFRLSANHQGRDELPPYAHAAVNDELRRSLHSELCWVDTWHPLPSSLITSSGCSFPITASW